VSPERLLALARDRGATEADTLFVDEESFSVQVRLGEVETLKHSREQRCYLRVFVGKRAASASTSDLSQASMERLVEEAVGLAQVTAEDPCAGLPDASALASRIPDLDLSDPDGHRISPEQKIALARRAEAAALSFDPRITNSEGGDFSDTDHRYIYATSHGFLGEARSSYFGLSVAPVAGEAGALQRDYWYSSARRLSRLDSPEAVGCEAARRALRRLGARKVHTQEVPVVFDPETARSVLRNLAGAAGGYALYRGTSFLVGKLGQGIAAAQVTIIDDGTLPGLLGSRPFDGEGLPVRRTPLVERGVLTSYLLDTYSARKLGLASTGHAAREGGGVTVGTTNLFLEPGPYTPEEIIRSVPSGFYVTELIGFGVNFVTGDYSRGAVGLWIEGGELGYPVEEVTIAGNLLKMFQDVEMVGNDLVFRGRSASPTIKIARMTVAGE